MLKEEQENIKKQTMKDIKKANKVSKKEGKTAPKNKSKKKIEPSKIAAIIIVSIIVATMLFGACASLIFYLQYYM